ncbi:hypothetical protein Taro_041086 [Colocasia esculenta]|uniref:Uncharacterized protein n=1 Tax=Colocasia esculenta TaxID=4460 RepID=A0A843WSD7_COLES|nr:hypothetical protein [Colocasia esculenta]
MAKRMIPHIGTCCTEDKLTLLDRQVTAMSTQVTVVSTQFTVVLTQSRGVVSTQSKGGVDTSSVFQETVRTVQEWCRHSPWVVSTLVLFSRKTVRTKEEEKEEDFYNMDGMKYL